MPRKAKRQYEAEDPEALEDPDLVITLSSNQIKIEKTNPVDDTNDKVPPYIDTYTQVHSLYYKLKEYGE